MITLILSSLKVILVDLIMSGDNAIIIAFASKGLPEDQRKKAMYAGIAGAAVMRIGLALVAVYLLQYPIAKYIGGILLLYVARSFFSTLKLGGQEKNTATSHTKKSLRGAIGLIIIADVSLSLDNVLAVASIAESTWILVGGLIISVVMMMFASQYIATVMEKHQRVQRGGLLIIVHAAMGILLEAELGVDLFGIPLGIRGIIIAGCVATAKYIYNVKHRTFHLPKHHMHNTIRLSILAVTFMMLVLSDYLPDAHEYTLLYPAEWLTLIIVSYMCMVELMMQQRLINANDKK